MRKDEDKNILEQGFTLVELLIVVVILGILAGIVVFAVGNLTESAGVNGCDTEATTVETAAEAYKADTGAYPTAIGDLTGGADPLLKSAPKFLDNAAVPADPSFAYTGGGTVTRTGCTA